MRFEPTSPQASGRISSSPDTGDAAGNAERVRALRLISLALIIDAVVMLIINLVAGSGGGRFWSFAALLLLAAGAAAQALLRAGRPAAGEYALIGLLSAGYLMLLTPSLFGARLSGLTVLSALVWFGILVVVAGLFLSRRAALAAIIAGLAVLGLALALGNWGGRASISPADTLLIAAQIAVFAFSLDLVLRASAGAAARAETTRNDLERTREALQGQLEERTHALALAATVGRQLTRIRDLDTLLNDAVELIRDQFDLYHVQVYLVSPATQELVLRAATGETGAELLRQSHRLAIGPGSINGTAAASCEPISVPFARQNPIFLPNPLLPETQSELAMPMIFEDEITGTLNLQSRVPGDLGPENLPAFTLLAAQLATAVENARLFTEITETREQLAQQTQALTRDGWRRFVAERLAETTVDRAITTELADPMRQAIDVRGTTIGFLEIGRPATDSARAQELAAAVAGQLGAHLENLRLTQQAEAALSAARQREEELALLNRIVTAIAASSDLQTSLQLIVDQLAMATGIQQVGVAIINEERTGLTVVADRSGQLNTDSAVGFVIPMENNPATQMAIAERRPVIVPNATENPLTASAHEVLRQRGVETILILPLIVENEVIGTVGLDVVEEGIELTDDQLRLAETIVYQAASAIRRARLFNQVRDRSRQLETLSRIEADLSLATTEDEFLLTLAGGVPWSEQPTLDLTYLSTRTGDGALLAESVSRVHDGVVSRPAGAESQPLRTLPLSALWLDKPRELLIIEDVERDPRLDEAMHAQVQREGRRALVVLPLRRGGQWQGVLTLGWSQPHSLTADETFILQRLHEPLAATVAGRRAYLAQRAALAQTEALYNVSARLNMAQSYDDVLTVIRQHTELGRAADALQFAHFNQVWLPDRPPEYVAILAQWNQDAAESRLHRYRLDDFPVVRLLRADRPTVFADIANDPRLDRVARDALREPAGLRSAVFAPLVVGGQWIGYIGLFYQRALRFFAEEEIDGLAGLIGQVSVSAQTILLLEQTRELLASEQRQRRIADTLLNSARVMSESLDENVLRGELLAQLYETVPAASVINLYEWLPDENRFRLDRRAGDAAANDEDAAALPDAVSAVERPELWQVLTSGNGATQPAAQAMGEFYRLPWRIGPRPAGVIEIYRVALAAERPIPLSVEDQRRCEGIIQQAALAFQNAQSYSQAQNALASQARLSGELRAVSDVSVTAAATLDVDRLLSAAADLTKENFGLYHTHIYLLDNAKTTLVLRAGAGQVGRQMVREGRVIPLEATSIVARAARERDVVLVDDTRQSADFLPHPLLPDTRSEMAVPLVIGDRLLGVLDVQSDEAGRFHPDDRQVYKILAAQLAVATQNATYFGEQLEMAEKLREVDRLKTDFLARMSHELRTPLNSIIGFADVLLMGLDGDLTERMIEDLQLIRGGGFHLRDIIGDILDMSKIEAGRLELTYESFDVRRVASELMATAAPLAEQKGLSMRLDIGEDIRPVAADRTRVRQVLWNIIGNAIKFTDHGGIAVSIRPDNGALLFAVADTGIGISPENLPRIFDHFSQIDAGRRESISGTGLGLSISKSLVELHGGRIWAESEPGLGTTFSFTIPVQPEVISPEPEGAL